jgi:hypothetical protein
MRPIWLVAYAVNHGAPSGPTVIPQGSAPVGDTGNKVTLLHVCAGALAARPSTNAASQREADACVSMRFGSGLHNVFLRLTYR